jgi:hypothetical protein
MLLMSLMLNVVEINFDNFYCSEKSDKMAKILRFFFLLISDACQLNRPKGESIDLAI